MDEESKPKKGKQTKEDRIAMVKPHQWKKGQSGNPSGRPKNVVSITAAMKAFLDTDVTTKTGAKKKALHVLVRAMFTHAAKGNSRLAKEIWDRIDGPIPDEINVSGSMADIVAEAMKAANDYTPEQKPE